MDTNPRPLLRPGDSVARRQENHIGQLSGIGSVQPSAEEMTEFKEARSVQLWESLDGPRYVD